MAKTKAPVAVESEIRRFKIDPHAIMSLIKAQAGSIHKAMLEAVANSMDAGATRIDIEVSKDRIVIKDDGHGLAEKEDIYKFFEVFGFDHSQLGRSVGRFGVGRGQLFCFGVNTWRTNNFEMSIDIKNKGLDYDLRAGLPKAKGMTITIDLNEPLLASEQLQIEEEFRRLVRYSTIPVYFNGKQISEDPTEIKWPHETDEAWIQIRKDGRMDVYSQGLFVKSVWDFGVGGRIVTKPGQALEQNLARNDILVKECPVWKKVNATVKKLAEVHIGKASASHNLTPEMRRVKAKEALTPEGTVALLGEKLFTLTNNKHVSLEKLLSTGLVTTAKSFDQAADKFIQRNQAMVVDEATLERFGADTVTELLERIAKAIQKQRDEVKASGRSVVIGRKHLYAYHLDRLLDTLKACKGYDVMGDMPLDSQIAYDLVDVRKLTPEEKGVAFALKKQMRVIAYCVGAHRQPDAKPWEVDFKERKLAFFNDNGTTQAFTDGETTIWLNRKVMMQKARKGSPGFMELVALLVHEYLHDKTSQSAHGHPPEFYEDFHNILLDGSVANYGLSAFALSIRHGLTPTVSRLSMLEKAGVDVDTDIGSGLAQRELDAEEPAPVSEPATPRRRRAAMA